MRAPRSLVRHPDFVLACSARDFGAVFRLLRRYAGTSQVRIAAAVDMTPSRIGEVIRGQRAITSLDVIERISDGLGIPGHLLGLAARPWETAASAAEPHPADGGPLACPVSDATDSAFGLRSHKLVAAFVGSRAARQLVTSLGLDDGTENAVPGCAAIPVGHTAGTATLYVWEHGATVVHIVEEDDWPDVTSMALWRYATYERDLKWAESELGLVANNSYVLSLYWLTRSVWTGPRREAALKLICSPRILVGEEPTRIAPAVAERALLRDGVPDTAARPFGSPDSALGLASWSGVVYHPLDSRRALRERDVVAFELAVQSVWQYCSWIAYVVETGEDPEVPDEYGWRWLRAVRSRLLTARPQETGPHKQMREAILDTCGLPAMLDTAIATLKETT